MNGATIATMQKRTSTMRPSVASRLRMSCRVASRTAPANRKAGAGASRGATEVDISIPDARIEQAVDHVGHDIGEEEKGCDDEGEALHHRKVAVDHRIEDGRP